MRDNRGVRPRFRPDTVVRVAGDRLTARRSDDAVVLDLDSGTYFGFEGIGAAIWELVQRSARVDAIRDAILARYDVTPERCEADLESFLGEMLEKRLIVVESDERP